MTEHFPATIHQVEIIADVNASRTVPALIAAEGERASYRFFEFFSAQIRNPHTRRAFARAVQQLLVWCEQHGVRSIAEVERLYVGT
jgi:hypothetical protein